METERGGTEEGDRVVEVNIAELELIAGVVELTKALQHAIEVNGCCDCIGSHGKWRDELEAMIEKWRAKYAIEFLPDRFECQHRDKDD